VTHPRRRYITSRFDDERRRVDETGSEVMRAPRRLWRPSLAEEARRRRARRWRAVWQRRAAAGIDRRPGAEPTRIALDRRRDKTPAAEVKHRDLRIAPSAGLPHRAYKRWPAPRL
jgi:hypothetical protein